MTWTIGRSTVEDNPTVVRQSGDELQLGFTITDATTAGSVDAGKVLRQQLHGMVANADEEVFPIVSTIDPTLDGFYRVRAVNTDPFAVFLATGSMQVSLSLERLSGGYSFPQQELVTAAITRTNNHTLTGEAIAATYPALLAPIADSSTFATASFTRATADDATVSLQVLTETPTVAPFVFSSWMPPARHYLGRCRVEVNIGRSGGVDGPWYELVGRQPIPSDYWRISNGIIRLVSAVDRGTGTFEDGRLEVWTGSAWESIYIRHFTSAGAGETIGLAYDTDGSPLSIIRNSPECVVVRCAGSGGAVYDYTIKRGAMHVEAISNTKTGIGFASSTASTAITGGIRATSDDTNGNRLVFAIAETLASSLANGYIYQNLGGSNRTSMAMGVALGGAAAATNNTPAKLVDQFIGVSPWKSRVVSR